MSDRKTFETICNYEDTIINLQAENKKLKAELAEIKVAYTRESIWGFWKWFQAYINSKYDERD